MFTFIQILMNKNLLQAETFSVTLINFTIKYKKSLRGHIELTAENGIVSSYILSTDLYILALKISHHKLRKIMGGGAASANTETTKGRI